MRPVLKDNCNLMFFLTFFVVLAIIHIGNNDIVLTKLIVEIWECGDIALEKLSG